MTVPTERAQDPPQTRDEDNALIAVYVRIPKHMRDELDKIARATGVTGTSRNRLITELLAEGISTMRRHSMPRVAQIRADDD